MYAKLEWVKKEWNKSFFYKGVLQWKDEKLITYLSSWSSRKKSEGNGAEKKFEIIMHFAASMNF